MNNRLNFGECSLEQFLFEYLKFKNFFGDAFDTMPDLARQIPDKNDEAETEDAYRESAETESAAIETAEPEAVRAEEDDGPIPDYMLPAIPARAEKDSGSEDEYVRMLYGEISRKLLPIVDEVLNGYDTPDSPIYDDLPDKETVHQVVDRVLDIAGERVPEAAEIMIEVCGRRWNRTKLLRELVNSIVINEIFAVRRPIRAAAKIWL